MSKQSDQRRAERRAADVMMVPPEDVLREMPGTRAEVVIDEHGTHVVPMVQSVALIADEGGYRLAVMALPADVAERYALRVTEPEVLQIQTGHAMRALEDSVKGELDATGGVTRPKCPTCGAEALLRHPSKAVLMCAACNARHEVE
jgi:hypothetical protein